MIFENIKFLSHRLETIGVVLSWGAAVLAVLLYVLRPWLLDALRRYSTPGGPAPARRGPGEARRCISRRSAAPTAFVIRTKLRGAYGLIASIHLYISTSSDYILCR